MAKEKVVFAFAKSSKEPMVVQLCFVESMIKKEVEASDILVASLIDEVLDDDEKMTKDVVSEVEKEIF